MYDLSIELENRPGALAEMGEALGHSGVSVEGGGVFVVNGIGVAHFLVEDGVRARQVLEDAGITVTAINEVVVQRLKQDEPGQLGKLSRRMADGGINILVQYSDHDHQLILVVDNIDKARSISAEWARERGI